MRLLTAMPPRAAATSRGVKVEVGQHSPEIKWVTSVLLVWMGAATTVEARREKR